MSTLWSTWPRTIRPCTGSRHPYTFCSSPPSSLRTTCQYYLTLPSPFICPDIHLHVSWDTSMSQKSRFKMQTQGIHTFRNTFPQLPWGTIKNPTYIQTAHGCVPIAFMPDAILILHPSRHSNRLLTSGWWAYSRKPVSVIFRAFLAKLTCQS